MQGNKNGFVLYKDYLDPVLRLSMEQRGLLLTAVMLYASRKEIPDMDETTAMLFYIIKGQMDKDEEKYWQTAQARREAGKLGGRPPKPKDAQGKQEEPKKANGFSDKQNNPDKDKEKDKDVIDNVKEKNIMCEANALFERLWKLYPNKKGKGKVSDTQKKRLLAIGEARLVKAIERYSLELQKDAGWRKPQNGSTFFNSGYIDYLDENYVPGDGQQPAKTNFHNFDQRNYDYAELERQLLDAGRKGG